MAQAVRTPGGIFCETCVPLRYSVRPRDLFTIQRDEALDTYPVCAKCGKEHRYVALTPMGQRFHLEIVGPQPGDVMVTETGPGNAMLELSVVEDAVIAVFRPDQRDSLRDWVRAYCRKRPETNVWRMNAYGVSSLDDNWAAEPLMLEPSMYVNHVGQQRV